MKFLALVPKEAWIALLLTAILTIGGTAAYVYIHNGGVKQGRSEIQSKWDAEKLGFANEATKMRAEKQVKEDMLNAEAEKARKTKNDQIASIGNQLADALERLRNRPERPSGIDLSAHPSTGSAASCTGTELYREDGQFLAGEAARAQKLVVNLAECQDRHASAVRAVK